jgi:hypothetical protein
MRVITAAVLLAACSAAAHPRTAPLTPAPLTWDTTVERAMKILERAKMAPRYDERRAYFATEPGEPVSHTSEPEIIFEPRKGWRAAALFAWNPAVNHDSLASLTLTAHLAAKEIETELHALDRRFGKPDKRTGPSRVWVRGGVWLVVTYSAVPDPQTGRFFMHVGFRRDDHPLPP